MNRFTGQTSQSELTGLANDISNGSLHHLAETINLSLIAVSDDLHPKSDTNPSFDPISQQSIPVFLRRFFNTWRVLTFEKHQGRIHPT